EASDAKDGHRAYLQKHPDVTVVDVTLPDLTGFELSRRIRRDDPAAKIVMFSVSEDPACHSACNIDPLSRGIGVQN
ncbi:DNA-binding NarL/FixJ family response regulator, partial [Bradyrhizobium japonicum]